LLDTSPLESAHIRQQHLQQGFHFSCTCPRCTGHERTDAIIQHIQTLQNSHNDWSPSSTGSPDVAEELLDTYRDEGLEGFMDVPYGFAALAYNAVGDEEMAVEYAKRAEELILLKDGEWAPNLRIWSFRRRSR
jgi:hypothetical protein